MYPAGQKVKQANAERVVIKTKIAGIMMNLTFMFSDIKNAETPIIVIEAIS